MNDYSELESELKKLRPAQPSENLVARIERELAKMENCRASVSDATSTGFFGTWRWRFTETPYKVSLGLGLTAATAAILIFARLNVEQPKPKSGAVASRASLSPVPSVTSSPEFVPAVLTQVVYHSRDEGLHFPNGAEQPMRRVRSQTQQTMQWRNATTGASLRVSYPVEEVELIPVSGQ
jgi:hypothetical protein